MQAFTVKFDIIKNSVEVSFKERRNIREGISVNRDDYAEEVEKTFKSVEDALLELQNHKTEIKEGGGVYNIVEYYVQENKYDMDGELLENGDILEFSKMEISVVEQPTYNTVGVFDNFEDAIKKCNELEEGFLSF